MKIENRGGQVTLGPWPLAFGPCLGLRSPTRLLDLLRSTRILRRNRTGLPNDAKTTDNRSIAVRDGLVNNVFNALRNVLRTKVTNNPLTLGRAGTTGRRQYYASNQSSGVKLQYLNNRRLTRTNVDLRIDNTERSTQRRRRYNVNVITLNGRNINRRKSTIDTYRNRTVNC